MIPMPREHTPLWSDDEPLECVMVVPEARDVKTFVFRPPSGATFIYRAGQFLTLELPLPSGTISRTYTVSSYEEFKEKIESQPGFYRVPWGGDDADEDKIKEQTRATLRCFPLETAPVTGLTCPLTGKPAREWAIFARAY